MAQKSGVVLRIGADLLPSIPGARAAASAGVRTSADSSNRRAVAGHVRVGPGVATELDVLVHDPQTSGGLLAAVDPADVAALEGLGFTRIGSAHAGPASVEVGLA